MTIDNRLLLPFVMPFVMLFTTRLMWWAAGAAWTEPTVAAVFCTFIGAFIGLIAAIFMWEGDIEIGHIHIGRKSE